MRPRCTAVEFACLACQRFLNSSTTRAVPRGRGLYSAMVFARQFGQSLVRELATGVGGQMFGDTFSVLNPKGRDSPRTGKFV